MGLRTKVGTVLVLCLVMVGIGYWASPTKIVTITKTVEVEKKDSNTDKVTKTHTVTTKKELPNGGSETVTVQDSGTETKSSVHESDSKTAGTEESRTRSPGVRTNIYAIAGTTGFDFSKPVYGAGVQRQVLGPVNVGAYGMINGSYGLTLGLEW